MDSLVITKKPVGRKPNGLFCSMSFRGAAPHHSSTVFLFIGFIGFVEFIEFNLINPSDSKNSSNTR